MEILQQTLFQGSLSGTSIGLSTAIVVLFGIANLLSLLLIVRKLPLARQFQLMAVGLLLSVSFCLICLTLGYADRHFEPLDSVLGAFLVYFAFSTMSGGGQRVMPVFSSVDYWRSLFWVLIVDLAFARLSTSASIFLVFDIQQAHVAIVLGFTAVIAMATWLFNYASKIRGLVRTGSLLAGICGLRLLVEGFDQHVRWDFNSPRSLAMWVFWGAFIAALLSTFIRRSRRVIEFPISYSGSASFLVRRDVFRRGTSASNAKEISKLSPSIEY